MTSYIDCEDLRALSVQDPLNADLQRELSLSLFRHIAQASATTHNARSHSAGGFVPATTPTTFAPATTPTTGNFAYFGSNLNVSNNGPAPSRRRDPSLVRPEDMDMVEEDCMQTDNEDGAADHGNEYRQSGRAASYHVHTSHPFAATTTTASSSSSSSTIQQSCFASSDPFFLSVSELQAAANSRRLLEAKPFAASAMRVTPNPIQFGPLNTSSPFSRDANIPFYASPANNHMQMDSSLLQYR